MGICIGLGLDSKYTIALVGMAAMVFMVVDRKARRWWRHPAPYGAAILALALFSPVIWWNAQHGWASLIFQGPRRWQMASPFSTLDLIASVLVLLTPVGVAAALSLINLRGRSESGQRISLFAQVFTLFPLAVFASFSFRHRVELNWTAPVLLALLPPLAFAGHRAWLGRYWPHTFAGLFLLYAVTLYHLAVGWPGLPYPRQTKLLPSRLG